MAAGEATIFSGVHKELVVWGAVGELEIGEECCEKPRTSTRVTVQNKCRGVSKRLAASAIPDALGPHNPRRRTAAYGDPWR